MSTVIGILGCGWLGLPLARRLAESGFVVKGSTTSVDHLAAIADAGAEPYLVNIRPPLDADRPGFFDADVLFLDIPPGRRQPERLALYVEVVRAASDAAATGTVRWIVFASSTSVYPDASRIVRESDVGLAPSGSGGVVLAAEKLLREDDRFDLTILRFAGLYGYDRQPGRFLSGARRLSDGGAPVNLVHRDDAVEAAALVIAQNLRGRVFNICADAHPSRADLYTARALALGIEPPEFSDLEARAFKIVDNTAFKTETGFAYRYPDPSDEAP